jgi:hypothetical protein
MITRFTTSLTLAILFPIYPAWAQQAPASTTAMPAQIQPSKSPAASLLLQPALSSVQETVGAIKLGKWKKGSVREEAGDNINAILKDIQTNLPPLLKTADDAPDSISRLLPVSRNINALYDVLLRVEEAARISAPAEQATQLRQALIKLGNARRAVDDRLQDASLEQEKQVADLKNIVKTQAAMQCPTVPATPAPVCTAPTTKKKTKKKSSTSSATSPKSTSTPSATPQKEK